MNTFSNKKFCKICNIEKNLCDFNKDCKSKDNHRNECKLCRSKKNIKKIDKDANIKQRKINKVENLCDNIKDSFKNNNNFLAKFSLLEKLNNLILNDCIIINAYNINNDPDYIKSKIQCFLLQKEVVISPENINVVNFNNLLHINIENVVITNEDKILIKNLFNKIET